MREKYESLPLATLKDLAKARGLKGISTMKKAELIERMLEEDEKEKKSARETVKELSANTGDKEVHDIDKLDSGITAHGILEVMQDGYGFIRSANYLPGENDVYVSPSQIRRFNLKTGDILEGNTRIKTQQEKFSALLYLSKINEMDPMKAIHNKNSNPDNTFYHGSKMIRRNNRFHKCRQKIRQYHKDCNCCNNGKSNRSCHHQVLLLFFLFQIFSGKLFFFFLFVKTR